MRAIIVVSLVAGSLLFVWWAPAVVFDIAVAAVVVLATGEFYALLGVANRNRVLSTAGLLGSALLTLQMAFLSAATLSVSFPFFLMMLFSIQILRTRNPNRDELNDLLFVAFGSLYVAGTTGQIIFIRASEHGRELAALVIVTVFTRETSAHFAGLLFPSKRLLNASINTKKSFAGAAISTGAATVTVVALSQYLNFGFTVARAITFGVCLGIACQLGDLSESYLKRVLDHRHSGRILGPEGGLLDFLDAASFAIVTARILLLV